MATKRKIVVIDCEYIQPQFAAAYLIIDGDRATFIDNNTAHSVPLLLRALRHEGLTPEQVDYVIITHVHLDHAGGTSLLMEHCPRATLLAHPRATPHMIDPHKLVDSAKKVYGEEAFHRMYGQIRPIPEARTKSVRDGEHLEWGSGPLIFLHTRGHANHHICIHDPSSSRIFTGDAFGLAYPQLQGSGLFIFPSTSPTDFDPIEAKASVRRIMDTKAEKALLTHFGAISDLNAAGEQLIKHLDFSQTVLEQAIPSPLEGRALALHCSQELKRYYHREQPAEENLLRLDLDLNGAGIAHVALKRRDKR